MKITKLILLTMILSLIPSGCFLNKNSENNKNNSNNSQNPSAQENNEQQTEEEDKKIEEYYPFKPNVKYEYEGEGNEYASYTVYVDYIDADKVQLRTDNGGTQAVRVLENKEGVLSLLFTRGECYYREKLLTTSGDDGEILLKEPLEKGTSWTLPDDKTRTISKVDADITTPMGDFKAIEVTTQGKDNKTLDYYAKGVGLIKSVYQAEGFEVSSTLTKIESDEKLKQNVRFFYPNVEEDKIYFTDKTLEFSTNDITRTAIESAFRDLPDKELNDILSPKAKINSLYLNADNIVNADFSKEFTQEMNAGSGYESMILKCITNTLGEYYGTDQVYITVEGNPYASGHIEMKKGETFAVDLKNCFEYSEKEKETEK